MYDQNAYDGEMFSFNVKVLKNLEVSNFLERDGRKVTYCGPGSWILNLASQCP